MPDDESVELAVEDCVPPAVPLAALVAEAVPQDEGDKDTLGVAEGVPDEEERVENVDDTDPVEV